MSKEEKIYIGKGKMRVEFTPNKESEIREMLLIDSTITLGKFANVKQSEFYDLKRAGLAEMTDGQQKAFLKNKTKVNTISVKPEIILPGHGILVSEFAKNVSKELKETDSLFYRIDQKEIVEVGKIINQKTGKEMYTGFMTVKPNRFITLVEDHITPGSKVTSKEDPYVFRFCKESMKRETANTVLSSKILQDSLKQIERIFAIPIPIMHEGKITFPCKGYDKRFNSWLPHDAPEITKPEMSLEDAKKTLKTVFGEFCFQHPQDYYNAVAGLLTPFLRGLFPQFSTRTPVFFYLANR